MKTYTQEELQEILDKHKKWLNKEEGGERANLRNVDLARASLEGVSLCGANLEKANLENASLRYAYLENANLEYANLKHANLIHVDLENANLIHADLEGAILEGTDLFNANLKGVDLRYAKIDKAINCPIYQVTRGFGERNSTLTLNAYGSKKDWEYFTGCFRGYKEELIAEVKEKYADEQIEIDRYVEAIESLERIAELNK